MTVSQDDTDYEPDAGEEPPIIDLVEGYKALHEMCDEDPAKAYVIALSAAMFFSHMLGRTHNEFVTDASTGTLYEEAVALCEALGADYGAAE